MELKRDCRQARAMTKRVELRRHTDADGDALSEKGVQAATEIGRGLAGGYRFAISSGAQRATQTIACFLDGLGESVPDGVRSDDRFRSEIEDRWRAAYQRAGAGDIDSFGAADPELVTIESRRFGNALKSVFDELRDGEAALIVGHSPMQEAAVYGLTGQIVEPLGKGEGVIVLEEDGSYRVERAG
jgi:broad specificity phosphatase PhoE